MHGAVCNPKNIRDGVVVVNCQNVPAGGVCTVQCVQGFTSSDFDCPQQGGLIDVSSFSCPLPGVPKIVRHSVTSEYCLTAITA
jgi:hypothetical protein